MNDYTGSGRDRSTDESLATSTRAAARAQQRRTQQFDDDLDALFGSYKKDDSSLAYDNFPF